MRSTGEFNWMFDKRASWHWVQCLHSLVVVMEIEQPCQ